MARGWTVGVMAYGLLALPAFGGSALDDLSVVKNAVGQEPVAERPAPEARAPEPKRSDEPRWLKVRIQDRGEKKAKVSINLPLDLVRALEDDDEGAGSPAVSHLKGHKHSAIRLGDVLRALSSGKDIVEIEGDDATVRVWVE